WKIKDELSGKIMNEIVALRAKQRILGIERESDVKKCKGMARPVVKKHITIQDYRDSLNPEAEAIYKTMSSINPKKHNLYFMETTKKALSPFDDKRFVCDDGITTYPFGYESISSMLR